MTRPPVATNQAGALEYLGCSENRLEELRRAGIVRTLGRDWYSYEDLDRAVARIIRDRDTIGDNEETDGARDEARTVASKGNWPRRTTAELLRKVEGGSGIEGSRTRHAAGGGT